MLVFADSTYAAVKTSVVESWPRVTSKRLSADLLEVAQGSFAFSSLERLLPAPKQEQGGERTRAGATGHKAEMATGSAESLGYTIDKIFK